MIALIILEIILASQIAMTSYNYQHIDDNTVTGGNEGDAAKNLQLAAIVLSASFFLFINIFFFFNFITKSRSEFLNILSVIIVASIMIVSYHYLSNQSKSDGGYQTAKDALSAVMVKNNTTEKDISLIGGIVTLGVACLIAFLLFGKYILAEEKLITVKQPIYVQSSIKSEDTMNSKEPDYMSEISKNFIV